MTLSWLMTVLKTPLCILLFINFSLKVGAPAHAPPPPPTDLAKMYNHFCILMIIMHIMQCEGHPGTHYNEFNGCPAQGYYKILITSLIGKIA